ncbi:MAG: hypothetical protein MHM6MM_004394 [Cercozoa sp. M6MM]
MSQRSDEIDRLAAILQSMNLGSSDTSSSSAEMLDESAEDSSRQQEQKKQSDLMRVASQLAHIGDIDSAELLQLPPEQVTLLATQAMRSLSRGANADEIPPEQLQALVYFIRSW